MISILTGKIIHKGLGYIILDVGGIGYKIFLNTNTLAKISAKKSYAKFFVHQYVRENQLDLYGFSDLEELELFELLISISGIGPKAGLAILAKANVKKIKKAIIDQDIDVFTAASGIGKKIAYKIILELKEKITGDLSILIKDADIVESTEALKNLGYKVSEINQAFQKMPSKLKLPEEQIRWALKKIGK